MTMFDVDDLPALALFALVVRSQSFAEAGRRSGLVKSAISQRVARLEDRLGVQLLRRSTRRISLTEQGLRLYEHAAALLDLKDLATKTVESTRSAVGGRVRLNAPASFPRRLIVGALRTFVEAHPDVRVELTLDDRFVEIVDSRDDVVLRLTIVEEQGFVARRLVRDRIVLAGAPSYFARRGRPERPDDLLRHDCLRRTGMPARDEWRFGRPGARYSVPVAPRFETSDAVALREAAISGMGILVAPSLTIAEHVRAGRLETVLDGFVQEEVGLFAITPARRLATPAVSKLVDHLARTFAKQDLVLPGPVGAAGTPAPRAVRPSRRSRDVGGRDSRPSKSRADRARGG